MTFLERKKERRMGGHTAPCPPGGQVHGVLGSRKQKGCQGLLAAPQFTPKMGPLGLAGLAMAGRRGQVYKDGQVS